MKVVSIFLLMKTICLFKELFESGFIWNSWKLIRNLWHFNQVILDCGKLWISKLILKYIKMKVTLAIRGCFTLLNWVTFHHTIFLESKMIQDWNT